MKIKRTSAITRKGFTIVELLAVIGVGIVLASLIVATAGASRRHAQTAQCVQELRGLASVTQLYLADHNRVFFPYRTQTPKGTLWFFGLESTSWEAGEGNRDLDVTEASLAPYWEKETPMGICQAFPYDSAVWKRKFYGPSFSYGLNVLLSSLPADQVAQPAQTILFMDTAQINTFQAPASFRNPMIEEYYAVDSMTFSVHFRHNGHANAVFLDGHVESFKAVPELLSPLLPKYPVGRITPRGSKKFLEP